MKYIIYKIGFALSIYLTAMLFVWGISSLFPQKQAYIANIGDARGEVMIDEETAPSEESTEPVKTNPSDSQPFDFSVNVITEVDESANKPIILSKSTPKTEPPDIHGTLFAELKKRKKLVVYIPMRRLFKLKQNKTRQTILTRKR